MESSEAAISINGLSFVRQNMPVHLHSYAPLIVHIVNSRLEWLVSEDRESAYRCGIVLISQAWQDRKLCFSEDQFRRFARLRLHRLINWFQPEIAERQRINEKRWARRNERDRHRDQQWQEIHVWRWSARRRLSSSPASLPLSQRNSLRPLPRTLSGLLQVPTEEEQHRIEEGYGYESVIVAYTASNSNSVGGISQVRYARRLASSMGSRDKLRLLLPDRERLLLQQIAVGKRLADICTEWKISRARGTQIHQKALERLSKYSKRLLAGEAFCDLLAEAKISNSTINKRSTALSKVPGKISSVKVHNS